MMTVTESQVSYLARKAREEARSAMASKPTTSPSTIGELEDRLLSRVVGQDAPARALMAAYKRFRAGLAPTGRPAGIFLLIGPTGSGKSLLARQFATIVTGSSDAPLRIDCGEFTQAHEVAKLIGSPPGYLGHKETAPLLSKAALNRQLTPDNTLSVVLFDEVDKAHPRLWDLLLGIFDTGRLTVGDNTTVDFTQSIILLTGNTGARQVQEALAPKWGFTKDSRSTPSTPAKIAEAAARKLLRPEMFNRLDKILTFTQLTPTDLRAVLTLELEDLQARLSTRGITFSLTEPVAEFICKEGWDPRYGARELRRAIVQHLELPLADLIIDGIIPDDSAVQARIRSGAIDFTTAVG